MGTLNTHSGPTSPDQLRLPARRAAALLKRVAACACVDARGSSYATLWVAGFRGARHTVCCLAGCTSKPQPPSWLPRLLPRALSTPAAHRIRRSCQQPALLPTQALLLPLPATLRVAVEASARRGRTQRAPLPPPHYVCMRAPGARRGTSAACTALAHQAGLAAATCASPGGLCATTHTRAPPTALGAACIRARARALWAPPHCVLTAALRVCLGIGALCLLAPLLMTLIAIRQAEAVSGRGVPPEQAPACAAAPGSPHCKRPWSSTRQATACTGGGPLLIIQQLHA